MGASDSKLVFKQGILRLSNEPDIPTEARYWSAFWELPESAEDIFTLFSSTDIRRARDSSLPNVETLIGAVISRLISLRNHVSFPDLEHAPEREALNCIRILTRLLPFIFEADLDSWEARFFWGQRKKSPENVEAEVLFGEQPKPEELNNDGEGDIYAEDHKPLAEELIDVLVDLLFFSDFTVPRAPSGKSKVTYAIWQAGIGCNTNFGATKQFESNRLEVLRLLLTLTSRSMYMPANTLPTKGIPAITYLVTSKDKQIVLSVLCSLINTVLNYNPAGWKVPYDSVVFRDPKQTLVTYSLQLLLVLLLYPLPENFPSLSKNNYRHFLGRLHRQQDFQFLKDGIMRVLNQPIQTSSSYLPGSRKYKTNAPEHIMLFWEIFQCNKRFRAFVLDSGASIEIFVPILRYAVEYRTDQSKVGIARMCIFTIQTLSSEPKFCEDINKPFHNHDSLPTNMRLPNFSGKYSDYLIQNIYLLMTGSKGHLTSVYPALLAILNNTAAYLDGIGAPASAEIIELFSFMSKPSFLLANDTNHSLLHSILEFISSVIEHQYSKNHCLVYMILKSRTKFESLRNFTLESGQEEIERQRRLRKEQSNDPNSWGPSRANSMESVRSPQAMSRTPTLSNVPENSDAFAIGDDEDSDDESETRPTASQKAASAHNSRTPSIDSSVDDAVPLQLRGMSEKARGKMPVGTPTFSRQSSTTSLSSHPPPNTLGQSGFSPSGDWIETWLPMLPLHTILTLLSTLDPHISQSITPRSVKALVAETKLETIDPSRVRVHLFEWSALSLGWYESLLWGWIFAAEMDVSTQGTVGIWNGTVIRLFRVQEVSREGPTLMQPRGMVDAVGSNLVNRVTSLNLRSASTDGTSVAGSQGGANQSGRRT